jgi:hypothetical protein
VLNLPKIGNRKPDYAPKNEYYTPQWLFDALGVTFDLDVCSPKDHVTAVPADKFYTIDDDGLASDWVGLVWMNPPFSYPTPWVDKFIEHGQGIALIPLSRSRWFTDLWDKADAVMALPSNFKFVTPEGKNANVFMPVGLASMGEIATKALKQSNMNRVR